MRVTLAGLVCVSAVATGAALNSWFFDLRVSSSDQVCSNSNITLNGHSLATSGVEDVSTSPLVLTGIGQGSVPIAVHSQLHVVYLDVSWAFYCLSPEADTADQPPSPSAQLLTVAIDRFNGKAVEGSSGFTLSFNQTQRPQVLRLDPKPILTSASATALDPLSDWISPPPRLRLPSDSNSAVDRDLQDLQVLERELSLLQRLIEQKRRRIELQGKPDAPIAEEELRDCDSIRCYVNYFLQKAHGAAQVLYTKLPSWHFNEEPGEGVVKMHHPAAQTDLESQSNCIQPPPPCHCSPEKIDMEGEKGCECAVPGATPSHSHNGYHVLGNPEPSTKRNPFITLLHILLSIVTLAFIFRLLRSCCCSPRQRAERAARREEARTAREYHSAALSQQPSKWRKCFSRRSSKNPAMDTMNYEEKTQLVRQQENVLEREMQNEIRGLQIAHEVVSSMVRTDVCQSCGFNPGPTGTSSTATHHIHQTAYQISPHLAFMSPAAHHGTSSNPYRSSAHRPRPITIPSPALSITSSSPVRSRASSDGSSSGRSISGWSGLSGVSRNTTLPPYRTDASDYDSETEPPAYGEDDAGERGAVADGFSRPESHRGVGGGETRRYVPGMEGTARISQEREHVSAMWSPQSAGADADGEFSPRASMDTLDSRGPGIVGFTYV
ncbi:hypothetical protein P152DRAFT_474694 [Eremomyces bilateralis CBS 781.70]|uniref:Uncharacterized protein n=1 Tax=Eremomyces bilateralis CBS 781.70 TaxID=1392243 RepID=A0A6G1G098_9PEZI|nr:uncharacterized protein P152DRAFT_474694 [Eremomyces bilateralis CBS 781.70]KAF1811537.1 hypothetical protein P152DRAFT_474694 [Eremomyces bilateralis CBS 781.70]